MKKPNVKVKKSGYTFTILDLVGKVKARKNKNVDPLKAREYMTTHYKRI